MHSDLLTLASSRAPRELAWTSAPQEATGNQWMILGHFYARARSHTLRTVRMLKKRDEKPNLRQLQKVCRSSSAIFVGSVLLMPVWIMDELPVQLLRLLGIELLSAFWALEGARHLDAHVHRGSVTRLRSIANLHRLGHDA